MGRSNSTEFSRDKFGPGEGEGDGKCLEMPDVSASMIVERSVGGGREGSDISGVAGPREGIGDDTSESASGDDSAS
jgi:hypothetical protein